MSSTDKTSRCFNFLLWLLKSGKEGIAVDYILTEYQISKKTFFRDIKELNKISDLLYLQYHQEEQRVYAHWKGGKMTSQAKALNNEELILNQMPTFFHQLNNKNFSPKDKVHISPNPQTEIKLQPHEFSYLLNATLHQDFVNFTYHQKERDVVPLLFCQYSERWYLLALVHPIGKVLKFRIDEVEKVQIKRYRQPLLLSSLIKHDEHIDGLKNRVLKTIQFSQNIFVDLNHTETLKIKLRFYFPLDFLKREIKQFDLINRQEREDPQVQDIEMHFHGYEEAKVFLNKWLGNYSILAPDWIVEQYTNDLEEAIDILQV